MSGIDPQTLRKAFGSFMTGVTVVTARTANGEMIGFTANSFSSVSMDPPLLLVCPGNHLSSFEDFKSTSHFAISILAEGQESIANIFASATEDRFENVQWHEDQFGSPLIDGAVATFSCSAYQCHSAGDHIILIGEVLDLKVVDLQGLGYCSSGYFSISGEQQSDKPSPTSYPGMAGAIIEFDGRVLVTKDRHGVSVPCIEQTTTAGARSSLQQHFEHQGLAVTLGTVFSIYDDNEQKTRFTFIRAQANSADISTLETRWPATGAVSTFETIDSLQSLIFTDKSQATMMARYAAESRLNTFGVYIGSAERGDIHPLATRQE